MTTRTYNMADLIKYEPSENPTDFVFEYIINVSSWRRDDTGKLIYNGIAFSKDVFIFCKKYSSGMALIERIIVDKKTKNSAENSLYEITNTVGLPVSIGETVEWEVDSFVLKWNTNIALPGPDEDKAMKVIHPDHELLIEGQQEMLPLRF